MKMNDPFGRMERKQQADYDDMVSSLRKNGINTPEKARELIRKSREKIFKTAGVAVVLAILLSVAFPKAFPVVVCFAALMLAMCFKSLVNGKKYVERYIDEELAESDDEKTSLSP